MTRETIVTADATNGPNDPAMSHGEMQPLGEFIEELEDTTGDVRQRTPLPVR